MVFLLVTEDADFESAYDPVTFVGKVNSVGKGVVKYMEEVEVERSHLPRHLQF
jgi:hypothetical protein